MIDIHTHVIPGVDDGPQSWGEAIEMCRMAWEDGTKVMVATPHAYNGLYGQEGQDISEEIVVLKHKLKACGIGLEILRGAEIHSRPDLPEILERMPTLTLNSSGNYFLLEFPHTFIPPNVEQLIFQLTLKGFIPIIAHPERNMQVQRDVSLIEALIEKGALCQVTAMSISGHFGQRASKCVEELLQSEFVHLVASDAHSVENRPPVLSEAYRVVEKKMGNKKAKELFELNPGKIVRGEL